MRVCFWGLLVLAAPVLAQEKTPRMIEVVAHFARATDAQVQEAIAVSERSHGQNSFQFVDSPLPHNILTVQGVFTADVSEKILGKLKAAGAEILSSPGTITLSGRRATLENVRELRYPSKFSPPSQESGKVIPTEFETKNVGIALEVEPTVGPDNYTIDLICSPRIVEFLGFIDYSGVKPGAPPPKPEAYPEMLKAPLQSGGIWQPIFNSRELTTEVTLYDGQTLLIRESGKAPHLCIFLTARLLPEK